ncbi:MAG: hypothetical protein NTW03_02265 [Verrucomicrobia bacterium]|nr:hypothetical protein [Verrucomicrobiota bacterium]
MKTTDYGKLASTLRVLAESLPEMMSAMLQPHDPRLQLDKPRQRPLAGITDRIADHLNAEVCSIFLTKGEGRNQLVCREAHGYEVAVENKLHSTEEGLTGRIFRSRLELVLNYSVQDKTLGWAGTFDKELKSHGWSLLYTCA